MKSTPRGHWGEGLRARMAVLAAILAIATPLAAAPQSPQKSSEPIIPDGVSPSRQAKSQSAIMLPTRAGGPVVFDGGAPDLLNGNNIEGWTQFEDFALASSTMIESCTFWTLEQGGWNGVDLQYGIYADNAGIPGALIESGNGTVVSRAATGRDYFGFLSEFEQEFDFESPLSLPAGTYWLSIHVTTSCGTGVQVYWETGAPAFGSTGLETNFGDCGGPPNLNNGNQHAFQLRGTSCVEELYASTTNGPTSPSSLYRVDPDTAAATLVGPIGFFRVGSLAADASGNLFGIGERPDFSGTDVLLSIDKDTGAGTEIGPLGVPTGFVFSELSFRPSDGALFAYQVSNSPNHQLYQVNPLTGAATFIGPSGYSFMSGNGMAFDASDNLWMLNGCCGNLNLNLFNTVSGAATLFTNVGLSGKSGGMDFRTSTGTMYVEDSPFGSGTSNLATVDLTSGAATVIGGTGIHADGLAWVNCGGEVTDPCDEDTTAPVILDCPGDFTTTCNTEGGFNFDYTPTVDESCPYTVSTSWQNPIPFGENELSVTVTDQAGNSATCEFTVTVVPDPSDPYRGFSIATHDGWVREPDLVNMIEGPINSKASTFDVGDDAANWGRRSILSFDTSPIPSGATITSARIRLTRATVSGNTTALGELILDTGGSSSTRGGASSLIGPTALLEPTDYDLASAANLDVATSFPVPAGNGHTVFADIDPSYFGSIAIDGLTQFRVRFANESDDDNSMDFISFHSGEAGTTVRPELIVEYFMGTCSPCAPGSDCDGPFTATLWSTPLEDGGLMESHFTSEVGGTTNNGATTSPVGDTASRQQLQVLLNFDTSSIPANAQITSAELRVYRASATGGWSSFGPIWVGMRNPCAMPWMYGTTGLLELIDFQAINSAAPVATLTVPATNTYTSAFLNASGLASINRGGTTQMKLYYPTADDGDAVSDQVQIGTGNYGATSPGRPRLVITYMTGCGGTD